MATAIGIKISNVNKKVTKNRFNMYQSIIFKSAAVFYITNVYPFVLPFYLSIL